jgi:hypothetical protein
VRPEGTEALSGYAFDPKTMRNLFELGVKTFQRRCSEVLGLLEIDPEIQKVECGPEASEAAVERAWTDIKKCPIPNPRALESCKN